MTAASLMTFDYAWIAREATLADAVGRLSAAPGLRCLLVGEEPGPLRGIITTVDLLRAVLATALRPGRLSCPGLVSPRDLSKEALFDEMVACVADLRIDAFMSSPVRTIPETATAGQAMDALLSERIESLPVVRGRRVVGVLHRAAVVRALRETIEKSRESAARRGAGAQFELRARP
jgi:CBS domain-containing protein